MVTFVHYSGAFVCLFGETVGYADRMKGQGSVRVKVLVAEIASVVKFVAAEVVSTVGFLLVLGWGLLWEFRHLFAR